MRFGSVCSGIEAASVAFNPLGWEAAWLAEIEPFPCSVLEHHYPEVPNLGDMTTIEARIRSGEVEAPDLFCGGTPCQSFSVAGLRKGLSDSRGNLSLEFIRIANAIDDIRRDHGKQPAYILWENVPGVLSSTDNAFGAFLGGLSGRESAIDRPEGGWPGAGVVAGQQRVVAWRTMDAQFFGVAQRRKRIFVLALGGAGGWACADALLPISNSLQGHPAPRRETGKAAPTIPSRSTAGGGLGTDFDCDGGLIPELSPTLISGPTSKASHGKKSGTDREVLIPVPELLCVATGQAGADMGADMAPTMNCNHEAPYIAGQVTHSLRGEGFDASEDGTGRGTPLVPVTQPYTLAIRGRGDSHNLEYRTDGTANALLTPNGGRGGIGVGAIAFDCKASGQNGFGIGDIASTQRAMGHAGSHTNGGGHQAVMSGMQVRRLTPRECERLQGFPDDYTLIPITKRQPIKGQPAVVKMAADGPRYKALGNSWAVPNVRWIGERIAMVDALAAAERKVA